MKIKFHGNHEIEWERTISLGDEEERREIFRNGQYVGTIIYRRRRRAGGGSDYGWQRERAPRNSRLLDMGDAINQLNRTT